MAKPSNDFHFQNQSSCSDTDLLEYAIDGRMFEMDLRIWDDDAESPDYSTIGGDGSQQGQCVNWPSLV